MQKKKAEVKNRRSLLKIKGDNILKRKQNKSVEKNIRKENSDAKRNR